MNDSEVLDWIQNNVVKLRMGLDESFTIEWINKDGFHCDTHGISLRDCIRGAVLGVYEFTEFTECA